MSVTDWLFGSSASRVLHYGEAEKQRLHDRNSIINNIQATREGYERAGFNPLLTTGGANTAQGIALGSPSGSVGSGADIDPLELARIKQMEEQNKTTSKQMDFDNNLKEQQQETDDMVKKAQTALLKAQTNMTNVNSGIALKQQAEEDRRTWLYHIPFIGRAMDALWKSGENVAQRARSS